MGPFAGLGLYPAAAYINHRCDPNVTCARRPPPARSSFSAASPTQSRRLCRADLDAAVRAAVIRFGLCPR